MDQLPLFLLNTVLVPGAYLPLRVFEPRYMDMVKQCLRAEEPFGVNLICAGEEIGTAADPCPVGTTAEIIRWDMQALGVLQITVRGGSRYAVDKYTVTRDQLVVADTQVLPEYQSSPVNHEHKKLQLLLGKIFAKAKVKIEDPEMLEDAAWLGWRLVEYLPFPNSEKQLVLECNDPQKRLALLSQLVTRLKSE